MTAAQKKQKKKDKVALPPWLTKILDFLQSPFFVGLLITVTAIFFARTFYKIRNQNKIDLTDKKISTTIFRAVEGLDFLLTDGRFMIRGEKAPTAPVAMLTVDDRSIDEVGRWPWSRDKIARVTEQMMKYGAKAIGFDIVFSEPQEDSRLEALQSIETKAGALPQNIKALFDEERSKSQPDLALTQVVEKYKDRLVLGAFPDSSNDDHSAPYADYCRNEAFQRANSSKFIKLENVSFVVVDSTDLFESVKFDTLFTPIFNDIEKKTTETALASEFQNKSVDSLSESEKRKLQFMVNQALMNYCDIWLDAADPYGTMPEKFFAGVSQKVDVLKGLNPLEAIHTFTEKVLIYPILQYPSWTINIDQLQQAATYTGSFMAFQDNDGKIRNNPLFYRTGNRMSVSFVPSLALQTYLAAHPGYQAEVDVDIDPKDRRQKTITSMVVHDINNDGKVVMTIPVDGQGRLKINYAGGTKMFPYIPAKEMLNDKPTMTIEQRVLDPVSQHFMVKSRVVNKADFIKDMSFIFGITAIGVYDLRVTPFEKNFPGPETHLNLLANLFDGNFLRVDPNESTRMTWALSILGILLSLAVAHSGALLGFVITFLAEMALILVDQSLLAKGIVATMVLPVLLILSIYVFMTLYKYFTEERKKHHLRSTFAKYVSPSVVDEILKSPENIELGGKKQRMSVFFSDVRGFTTISEKLDPQTLSDVLNRYLTPMTEIVFANRGTLDKYMGDAVMAFFGAPIQYKDHAACACRCALQSMLKLKDIQAEFKAEGLPEIDIGIGINTSDMSVGNMGSNTVRSYTVMGDGVNLGSRLEGINKEYGTRIIISQFTYEEVKKSFTAREVDWVRVKGKLEPVRIYELICEGPPPADWVNCLPKFNEGFGLYHEKKFTEAKAKFQEAKAARPSDPVSELYIERCDEYLNEIPPENWDGVYTMKTK